jgi:hypothetical protein
MHLLTVHIEGTTEAALKKFTLKNINCCLIQFNEVLWCMYSTQGYEMYCYCLITPLYTMYEREENCGRLALWCSCSVSRWRPAFNVLSPGKNQCTLKLSAVYTSHALGESRNYTCVGLVLAAYQSRLPLPG